MASSTAAGAGRSRVWHVHQLVPLDALLARRTYSSLD